MNQTCDCSKRVDTSLCLNCSSIAQCPGASQTQQYFVDIGMCSSNISMLTVDKLCKPCTVCQPGYWERKPCTQFSDRECSKCTVCEAFEDVGTYQTKACGKSWDAECKNCTRCKPVVPR